MKDEDEKRERGAELGIGAAITVGLFNLFSIGPGFPELVKLIGAGLYKCANNANIRD